MSKKPTLTTTAGAPIADNQNSHYSGAARAGADPGLPADRKARAPEPRAHSGTYGACQGLGRLRHADHHRRHLEVHEGQGATARREDRRCSPASRPSPASLARPTPSATCAASRSSSTPSEGNWDLVGNNTPVFFVRDPYKFPDFIHTQKRHPKTNMRSPTAMWDFWSLSPESLHQVTILMSDRGLPVSVRHMNGYGSHTYSLINAKANGSG